MGEDAKSAKTQRLAAALRANLKRRKAAAERSRPEPGTMTTENPPRDTGRAEDKE